MPIVSTGHITITDIKDTVGLVLTNEAVVVAAAPDGTVASLSGVATTASVLLGGVDDSANWALTAGTPSGMTGTLSGKTYTVTGVSADTAYVDLTASRTGYSSLTKRFSVSKSKQGVQGVQGPSVTVTANRSMSFTSTDGTLDTSQTDIVFTAATSGIASPTYAWTFAGLQTNPTASTTATQTITAAQFGTSRSATVTCTVGTYKQTLTIVRLEKSTADAGATVGATWGTNVGSIPANISTAGSTPTVDLRNNQIGLNASGQLYGAGAGNGTTVSNAQISVDTATGVIGGIGTGAGTAVANSQVAFSARQTWEFRGSAEGWAAGGATLTANADTITLTSTGTDPTLSLGGLSINGSVCDKLRMRVRRVGGSGWDGKVYFATSPTSPNTHGNSESYCKVLPSSLLSTSFVMLEWDMANLTVGGNNWTASTITAIRFDLGSTASDVFEIDWISVGKYGHDVDLVLSASSQIIAGTSTNGVVLDAASKSLQVMTGGNERLRLGNQPTAVNGTAYGMVVKDTSGNVVFDSRNNVGIVGNQTHDNFNLGDSTTNPDWDTNANGTGNVALGANALRADGLAKTSTRSNNVALGSGALRYTTTGGNIAVGAGALRGDVSGNTGYDNIAIGYNAMVNAVLPTYNIAIGRAVLSNVSAGSENVAIGYNAMQAGTNANYSVAVGHQALKAAQGNQNTAVGYKAGISQTSPSNNTLVGYQAGTFITTGGGNTVVGAGAGYSVVTGSGNTLIGAGADHGSATSLNNQTIIGSGAGVVLKHSDTLLETEHNISSGGNITASGAVKGSALTVEGAGPLIRLLDTDVTQSNFWVHVNNSKFYVLTDYDYDGNWDIPYPLVLDNATTTANIYGSKAWTAGNDGVDSGLDADLLDGQHGSYYLSWANLTGKPTTLAGYGITDAASSSHSHTAATTSAAGFMSAADKTKLDGVATNANNYSLPSATDSVLGGVKLASSAAQTVAANAVTTTASRTYGIQVNASGQLVVNVPWVDTDTNTVYTHPTSDGSLHVPATGTTNAGKVLTAGSTAGSLSWQTVSTADNTKLPLSGGTMTGAISFAATQTWPTFNQNTSGSAASLATARTLTVGNTGKTFNGSANVSWTLAEIGAAPATHSHTTPVSGNWFNGGYLSIGAGGAVEAGRFFDWHYASTDTTDFTARTEIDSSGDLTHSQGLKVKGTGGLGYAFGGTVTQATDRNTGVTLNAPSGTITLANVAVTAGSWSAFRLTNSCIAATDCLVLSMRNAGGKRYNPFVDEVGAGYCIIRLQNQDAATGSITLNFAIIKGANS